MIARGISARISLRTRVKRRTALWAKPTVSRACGEAALIWSDSPDRRSKAPKDGSWSTKTVVERVSLNPS